MKMQKTIIAVAALVMGMYTSVNAKGKNEVFTGTYGASADDPAQITLVLNEDHTYSFRDYSNPAKRIDVRGSWVKRGKAVMLDANGSTLKFHHRWKFNDDGTAARSRKGLNYYRICRN